MISGFRGCDEGTQEELSGTLNKWLGGSLGDYDWGLGKMMIPAQWPLHPTFTAPQLLTRAGRGHGPGTG